jgi:hypothetical protein
MLDGQCMRKEEGGYLVLLNAFFDKNIHFDDIPRLLPIHGGHFTSLRLLRPLQKHASRT